MNKGIPILLAALLLLFSPFEKMDMEKLHPVEVIRLTRQEKNVVIETDTGAKGTGKTVEQAMADLAATAEGEVFLETADYLIVSFEGISSIEKILPHLRPGCCLCMEQGKTELQNAAKFLQTHTPRLTLKDYRAGITDIPTLVIQGGSMHLEQFPGNG